MFTNTSGKSFYHPVTNQLIRPGASYDIPAHQDHENVVEEAKEQTEDAFPATLLKHAEKYGIDPAGMSKEELKVAVKEAAAKAKASGDSGSGEGDTGEGQ